MAPTRWQISYFWFFRFLSWTPQVASFLSPALAAPPSIQHEICASTNKLSVLRRFTEEKVGETGEEYDDADVGGSSWRLKRLCLCGGYAVHGFICETLDGTRTGYLLSNDCQRLSLHDDEEIQGRGCTWVNIKKTYHNFIVEVSGYHLNPTAAPNYLCHSLAIRFQSGQVIKLEGNHIGWRGDSFSTRETTMLDGNFYVTGLEFVGGLCTGVQGRKTDSSLSSANWLLGTTPWSSWGVERPSPVDCRCSRPVSYVCVTLSNSFEKTVELQYCIRPRLNHFIDFLCRMQTWF